MDLFNGTLEELYRFGGAQLSTEKPPMPQKHTIVAGDSFESVANKYGVTVRELISANPQLLKTGDQLTVPVAVAIPSEGGSSSGSAGGGSAPTQRTHAVKPGDTLTLIAIKYGTTVAAIASLNNITNINNISVGQLLFIP